MKAVKVIIKIMCKVEAVWDEFKCSLKMAYADPLTSNVELNDQFDM